MKKRIGTLMLALLLLLAAAPLGARVALAEAPPAERGGSVLSPLEEALYDGLMATRDEIGIEGLCDDSAELGAAMTHLLNSVPELFFVKNSYRVGAIGGVPVSVQPEYRMVGRELEVARAEYSLALKEIAAEVDPTLSEFEIALFLHDYLCKNYAYDTTLSHFDAHTLFTEGIGVCQSYTLAYSALLSRFEIPVTYATGRADGVAHIWSVLELDGVFYHVDVTWGDPLRGGADVFGMAAHDNFLQSDAAIEATGHSERINYGGVTATDDRYAEALITEVKSPFAFLGGDAYGMVDGALYRFSDDLATATLLYTVEEEWHTGGSMLGTKPAGVAAGNRLLYISTPHAILSYDPVSGTTEELLSVGSRQILALYGDGDTLRYLVADDIYGNGSEERSYTLPAAVPPCTGEHDLLEYATLEPLCDEVGYHYYRCTVCGVKETREIPVLPHAYSVTVVPPGYGTQGYTERVCPDCGDRTVDSYRDALPMPTAADYRAAVAAAEASTTAEELLAAVSSALAMEPHLDAAAIESDRAALRLVIEQYDARVAAINTDFGEVLSASVRIEGDLLTPTATILGVLLLVIRRLFGL